LCCVDCGIFFIHWFLSFWSCSGSIISAHNLPYRISSGVRLVGCLFSVGLYSHVLFWQVIFSCPFCVVCSSMDWGIWGISLGALCVVSMCIHIGYIWVLVILRVWACMVFLSFSQFPYAIIIAYLVIYVVLNLYYCCAVCWCLCKWGLFEGRMCFPFGFGIEWFIILQDYHKWILVSSANRWILVSGSVKCFVFLMRLVLLLFSVFLFLLVLWAWFGIWFCLTRLFGFACFGVVWFGYGSSLASWLAFERCFWFFEILLYVAL
jgi:hypothetical protein